MKLSAQLIFAAFFGLTCVPVARAEAVSFDRPGIAFASATLTPGSWAFEQGLPDFARNNADGAKTTLYSAGSNLRFGLFDALELQLATSAWNQLKVNVGGISQTVHGAGDARVALKVALPSESETFSWAGLGSVTLATGASAFSNDATQYDLGLALAQEVANNLTAGFYLNATRLEGDNSITISPSLSFSVTDTLGAYLEAGYFSNADAPNSTVAGGGVTWMLNPVLQLDASANFGLNSQSPDVTGGLGFSVVFP
jgi:hypothetical protein